MDIIREITPFETYPVRHPVLREGKPVSSCHFDGDELENTKHFGYFINSTLVGTLSIYVKSNHQLEPKKQLQMRGMAVLSHHQNIGIGNCLLSHVEQYAKQNGFEIIWCNAREKATPFYEKYGYKKIGSKFIIEGIGYHFVLYKMVH